MDTLCCIKIHFKNEVVEAGMVVEVGAVKKQGKVEMGKIVLLKREVFTFRFFRKIEMEAL